MILPSDRKFCEDQESPHFCGSTTLSFWVIVILRYIFFNFFEFLKKNFLNFLTIFFFKMFVLGQGIQWAKNFKRKLVSLRVKLIYLKFWKLSVKKLGENFNLKTNQFSFKIFSSLNSLAKNKHFEKKNCQKIRIFFSQKFEKIKKINILKSP